MAVTLSIPLEFQPGAAPQSFVARSLVSAGFEPGYPLLALRDFDPMWIVHTLSGRHAFGHLSGKPRLTVTGLSAGEVPLGPGEYQQRVVRLPLRISVVRVRWTDMLHDLLLEGELEQADPEATLTQDGRKVHGHRVRLLVQGIIDESAHGYIQLVPIGYRGKHLPPTSERLVWAPSLPVTI